MAVLNTSWVRFFRPEPLLVALGLVLCTGHAQASLFADDEARRALLELRQESRTTAQDLRAADQSIQQRLKQLDQNSAEARALQEAQNKGFRDALFDMQNQLESLRKELALMRGEKERLERDLGEQQQKNLDLKKTLDDRLRRFEPIKVQIEGKEQMVDPAEKKDHDTGLAAVRSGDFADAGALFGQFIRKYPNSPYLASALFWLGNAEYAQKDCKQATERLREMLRIAPGHSRAADAMLVIANCQIEQKDNRSGRKTLEDLIESHPQSEAAQAARDRLKRLR
jgi:tol-pal system protein YbgF